MNLSATIKAMAAAGLSADQIADVVARVEEERMAKARAGNARRQQALRDRRNENNAVTPVTDHADNGESTVTAVTKESPHTPKESLPPLPSPPKGGSVRPPAGASKTAIEILAAVVSAEVAAEVAEHRKAMKCPLTVGSAKGLAKRFAATSDPPQAARDMMANGWRGYNPGWANGGQQARAGPRGGRSISELAQMDLCEEPPDDHDRTHTRNGASERPSGSNQGRSGFAGRLSVEDAEDARRRALVNH